MWWWISRPAGGASTLKASCGGFLDSRAHPSISGPREQDENEVLPLLRLEDPRGRNCLRGLFRGRTADEGCCRGGGAVIYLALGVVMWPLFWLGLRDEYRSTLGTGALVVIVTLLAVMWPLGIIIVACLDHADRHP